MSDIKNGGPAFPFVIIDGNEARVVSTGITARDYFAAAALQGMLASSGSNTMSERDAAWAYKYADALLKEREK